MYNLNNNTTVLKIIFIKLLWNVPWCHLELKRLKSFCSPKNKQTNNYKEKAKDQTARLPNKTVHVHRLASKTVDGS